MIVDSISFFVKFKSFVLRGAPRFAFVLCISTVLVKAAM